ncbi:PilC/PilY family type IV pilus protein [Alteromonas lipotrueiana]|uniref:PilC/PilY family type IV pilus protein n=1 Tax=Alteromonas lipotrueiana TaxID=2803815 RepID=UPI001C48D6A4|nr:PilC/PilY family type IV pilus protein [Alteromonas lipotrueiana]
MKTLARFTLFSTLWLGIGAAAIGDDLDIYLGTADSATTYKPNVMFIMDTSGSMQNQDDTEKSRMLRVKEALSEALSSATDINAGLMRFSDYGGPVLYPVRDIDGTVYPEIVTSVNTDTDDGSQAGNYPRIYRDTLDLSNGTQRVISGVRFSNLKIPQGAVIENAYIRFTSAQLNVASTDIKIMAEDTGDAQTFSQSYRNISNRNVTSNFVDWQDNGFPVNDETLVTPDISSVVQEVVDSNAWCGGQAMNILFDADSSDSASARKVHAYDAGTDKGAQLVVTYDQSTASGCMSGESFFQINDQSNNREESSSGKGNTGSRLDIAEDQNDSIGLRFTDVKVAPGSEIEAAYLILYSNGNFNSESYARVRGINVADVSPFDDGKKRQLRNYSKTAGISWRMPGTSNYQGFISPNIRDIVKAIVGRSDWQSGNNMGFVLDDFQGNDKGVFSYKGHAGYAPRLYIKYKGDAQPGQVATVREHLISKVNELSANGYTPIVDTLYEAVNYYGGRAVDYGRSRGRNDTHSSIRRSTRVSHRSSYIGSDPVRSVACTDANLSAGDCVTEYIPAGAVYDSPISDLQCQTNNHIVLLSDGEANFNHSVDKIQSLLGATCSGSGGEACGLDLVRNVRDKDTSKIDRRIMTHTIGFAANATANNFLNKLALQGGGGFYKADDSTELLEAFDSILRSVKDVNATFVSPGVAVNQLNRLTHRDELYFALFKPAEGALWPGNLKKYRLDGNTIVDKDGINAVDSVTGYFTESSHSFWSVLNDGNDVNKGGAISLFDSSRNMFFFEGNGTIKKAGNWLHEMNSNITIDDMGLGGRSDRLLLRDTVLKWSRGVDIKDADGDGDIDDVRLQMGDPIHSQPVIVNYSPTDSAIFVATNQGFLHSFDAESGEENFAIIPKDLLQNLHVFYEDNSTLNHIYGLDGDIVYRKVDNKQYLYVGMRRGGRNYYVFDVTSKTSPKLVYSIKGGETGLEKLGQTWSRPTITKMKIGDTVKNVMIVGGGYDEQQDDRAERSPDSVGNGVFIFDADTGTLLWSASNTGADLNISEMQYSIPGRISVIDRDRDGLADHMYVADMGGQIFRLDIYNGKSGTDLVKGGRLADFGGTGSANNRHFYYGPDISEIALDDEIYYAVAIGSGWRAAPLNVEVDDRFYMLKDKGVFITDENGLYTFSKNTTQADLFNATSHALASSDSATRDLAASAFAGKSGWYLEMTTAGEKILASPLIIDYKVLFTSYIPAASSQSACAPPTGSSRAYLVNLVNGNAVDDLNQNEELDHSDRYTDLSQSGIAPETKVLIEEITTPVVCLGTECASAVIETNEDGSEKACSSTFTCLMQNIYGRFERVMHESWQSEFERE